MITIKEVTPNYNNSQLHYKVYYNDGQNNSKLGDIYFDRESLACTVYFYGWSGVFGIPLSVIELILIEIKKLEQQLKITRQSDHQKWRKKMSKSQREGLTWDDLILKADSQELDNIESPSGQKCPVCTKEMNIGEAEIVGICLRCYEEESSEQKLR